MGQKKSSFMGIFSIGPSHGSGKKYASKPKALKAMQRALKKGKDVSMFQYSKRK